MNVPIPKNTRFEIERSSQASQNAVGQYRITAWLAAGAAIVVGGSTLLGWLFNWTLTRDIFNVGITMKANAGLATALIGIATLLLLPPQARWARRGIGFACASLALVLGALTLTEHLFNLDLGIDQLLAEEPVGAASTTSPGRMGPPASTAFALLGIALLMVNGGNRWWHVVGQGFALLVGVIGMLSILGNLYGVEELFALARYTGISLQTSIALVLLCVAYMSARPNRGIMVALSSPESGGILVRRLLLPCILLPVLLGWIYGLGVRNGLFDEQFGMAMLALALAMALTSLVLWSGISLNRAAHLRRQAELAVIHNERLYRAIGESINYGIWVCDAQGRNTYFSHSFLDLLGVTQEQCAKFGWTDLLHPEDADATVEAWKKCAARGDFWERAHRFRGKDGQWHHILARGVPIRDDQGEIIAWAGINLDISKLKETEDELRRHKEHLEHLVLERTKQLESSHQALRMSERMAAMGTLVAGLGHDMGNLLLPVRARLDTLEHTALSESAQADVTSIRACVEHLQQLSSGLRLFALDPDADADLDSSTDMSAWQVDVEPFMRNALPHGVNLLWGNSDDLPLVRISKHRLTQAVYNLVKNAGDAMAARGYGTVAVSARVNENRQIEIEVHDDGPGMSEEVRRHCIEPFYTTKKRSLSTGLGLSIVHGIVQRCGGSMEIRSQPDRGSSFVITLPIQPRKAEANVERGLAIVQIKDPRLGAMIAATLSQDYAVELQSELNGRDADLYVADWSDAAPLRVRKFLDGRHARRALVVNCPAEGIAAFDGDQRIKAMNGWPKVSELRQAINHLSQG